eukprot:scaffold2797_cov69-Phaeocystis_antarctica.AAC.4
MLCVRACVVEVLHVGDERMQQHQHPEDGRQLAEARASRGGPCGGRGLATAAAHSGFSWKLTYSYIPKGHGASSECGAGKGAVTRRASALLQSEARNLAHRSTTTLAHSRPSTLHP